MYPVKSVAQLRQDVNRGAGGRLTYRLKGMLPHGAFAQSIALMGGGAALGQGIAVLATPVLTRLFTPSDFGILGAFISLIWIWCETIAWQYDQAIPLAKEEDMAKSLLALSLLIAVLMIGLIGTVSGPFAHSLFGFLKSTGLLPYLWLTPVGVAGAGVLQILNRWAIRQKAFVPMAGVRAGQALVIVAAQLLGGMAWIGPLGLLMGDAVGRCMGCGVFAAILWRNKNNGPEPVRVSKISAAAKRYWRFPAFSMGSGLVSNASLTLPPLLFAAFFSIHEAGWFALAVRAVGAPSYLVGQAVGNVYWAEAAERVRNNPLALKDLYSQVVTKLIAVFVAPMALLAIMGPWIFALLFGAAWRPAGEFAQWLALPFLLRIAVGPVSMTLNILERQEWQMFWDFARAILVIGGILLAHHFGWSAKGYVKLYALTMAFCYASMFVLSAIAINQRILAHGSAAEGQAP